MIWTARRYARAALVMAIGLLLAGCNGRKDLSPPPVNTAPRDKLELVVTVDGHETDYPVTVSVQYGNLSKDCSNIDYWYGLGGYIDFPRGDVAVRGSNGLFEIYRDYYVPKEKCSWQLLGVDITIHAPNGRHAGSGISRREFQSGFRWKVKCSFDRSDINSCFPLLPSRDHIPGIYVAIEVR
ncbi:hypothetical protein [Dyella sp. C9]|uniref:hypothetical protein n=1 Tax=Dyella sp. C9 TaxID=2202154 RepID=UPI001E3DFD2B|nr:hypothetical protein [Dyella sp. C9]